MSGMGFISGLHAEYISSRLWIIDAIVDTDAARLVCGSRLSGALPGVGSPDFGAPYHPQAAHGRGAGGSLERVPYAVHVLHI